MNLIEVRPLRPFVGSHPCALADADYIDDVLAEKDGMLIKTRAPRKRFVGLVPVQRMATADEVAAINAKALPAHIDVMQQFKDGAMVIVHPMQRTLNLPEDIAASLIDRGLAEAVKNRRAK